MISCFLLAVYTDKRMVWKGFSRRSAGLAICDGGRGPRSVSCCSSTSQGAGEGFGGTIPSAEVDGAVISCWHLMAALMLLCRRVEFCPASRCLSTSLVGCSAGGDWRQPDSGAGLPSCRSMGSGQDGGCQELLSF